MHFDQNLTFYQLFQLCIILQWHQSREIQKEGPLYSDLTSTVRLGVPGLYKSKVNACHRKKFSPLTAKSVIPTLR